MCAKALLRTSKRYVITVTASRYTGHPRYKQAEPYIESSSKNPLVQKDRSNESAQNNCQCLTVGLSGERTGNRENWSQIVRHARKS